MNRKYLLSAVLLLVLTLSVTPTVAQTSAGFTVRCSDGVTFTDGVEFVIRQVRPGYEYLATAVGSVGFDPILAVIDPAGSEASCSDDAYQQGNNLAWRYGADLPSSDQMVASPSALFTSQVTFANQSSDDPIDISLVVGNHGNRAGEFLLFLEGFAVTAADGDGDAVSVNITPGMIASETPITVYMLKRGSGSNVNTLLYQSAPGSGEIARDSADNPLSCDDAGNAEACYSTGTRLDNSRITIGQNVLVGARTDSMLSVPLGGMGLSDDRADNFLTFLMSSHERQSEGEYLLIFHIAIATTPDAEATGTPSLTQETLGAANSMSTSSASTTITCEDGTIIHNGVEIIANEVRSGFTYAATALGVDGFDPVLAVLDTSTGGFVCSTDSYPAAAYEAYFPTSGIAERLYQSAQVIFYQNSRNELADVSVIVGSTEPATGAFLLILEGMGINRDDDEGDSFSVNITPGMAASNEPLTVYMMMANRCGCPSMANPRILLTTPGSTEVAIDTAGNPVVCDDTGVWATCYDKGVVGDETEIGFRAAAGYVGLTIFDSMLTLPLHTLELNADRDDNYLNLLMTTSEQGNYDIEGDYWLVFDIGAVFE